MSAMALPVPVQGTPPPLGVQMARKTTNPFLTDSSGVITMFEACPSSVTSPGGAFLGCFMGGCQMIMGGGWLAWCFGGGVQPHIASHSRRAAPEPP